MKMRTVKLSQTDFGYFCCNWLRYMVATVAVFRKKYDVIILWRFIYFCGKFHTDTINCTVFEKEFVKLVWEKWKLFQASLTCLSGDPLPRECDPCAGEYSVFVTTYRTNCQNKTKQNKLLSLANRKKRKEWRDLKENPHRRCQARETSGF